MANDLPVNLTPQIYARFARMLRDYEAGNLTPPPGGTSGRAPADDSPPTFKVTAHESGGGKYTLQLVRPGTTDITTSGNLAASDLGTLHTPTSASTKYLGLNLPEVGLSSHAIDVGAFVKGTIERRQTNGIIVVHIVGFGWDACTT